MPSMTSSKTSDNLPAGTLTVTGLHPSGAGLSTFEGLSVLVPGAIPGDVVDAHWTPRSRADDSGSPSPSPW